MSNCFILIVANIYDSFGNRKNSLEEFYNRIRNNSWNLNHSTANKELIQEGDRVAFYVSEGRKIVGQAVISEKISLNNKNDISYKLSFSNIKIFKSQISFLDKLKLSSMKPNNLSKWGVIVMGGLRKISNSDFEIFTN